MDVDGESPASPCDDNTSTVGNCDSDSDQETCVCDEDDCTCVEVEQCGCDKGKCTCVRVECGCAKDTCTCVEVDYESTQEKELEKLKLYNAQNCLKKAVCICCRVRQVCTEGGIVKHNCVSCYNIRDSRANYPSQCLCCAVRSGCIAVCAEKGQEGRCSGNRCLYCLNADVSKA